MKKLLSTLTLPLLAFALVAGLAAPALAYDEAPGTSTRTDRKDNYQQILEDRKAAFKERLTELRDQKRTKLEERRLAICDRREEHINTLLKAGVERSKRHLALFQKISDKVQAFYTKKSLSVEGYDAAVAAVEEKEAAAVAAVEETSSVSFVCSTVDADRPGQAIKEALQIRHTALKEYRKSIKELILVVKKANGQHRTDADETKAPDESGEEQ